MATMINIDIQHAIEHAQNPSDEQLMTWASSALQLRDKPSEISIRLVDEAEMIALNQTYRQKSGPTNVLAFPAETPPGIDLPLLGDIIICVPQVLQEAQAQHKTVEAHFAHLTIHGCLHLLGYDHDHADSAEKMENLEIDLLKQLNYPNPYQLQESPQ